MLNESRAIQVKPAPRDSGWTVALQWMGLVSLLLLLAAILTFHSATPDTPNLFDRWLEGRVRRTWNLGLVAWSRGLLWGNLGVCILGFLCTFPLDPARRLVYLRVIGAMALATLVGFAVQELSI